jgi:neutral ceramidase
VVVLNNCASGYADYVTTFEEYQHQRYEGGSTAYGPHTHSAFTQVLVEMALEMASGNVTFGGVPPSIPSVRDLMELQPAVAYDERPPHGSFGGIVTDVPPGSFKAGRRVSAQMWGAHPRNNLRHNSSFASVWRRDNKGSWHLVADDNDWETRFEWRRKGVFGSVVTVTWDIPTDCAPGNYSLGYAGDAKTMHGHTQPIGGYSRIFEVLQ